MDTYWFYIGGGSFHEDLPATFIFTVFSINARGVQVIS